MAHTTAQVLLEMQKTRRITDAVREYLNRMVPRFTEYVAGSTEDAYIDCPRGHHRGLEFAGGKWTCRILECNFELPAEYSPPGPAELKEVIELIRK